MQPKCFNISLIRHDESVSFRSVALYTGVPSKVALDSVAKAEKLVIIAFNWIVKNGFIIPLVEEHDC